MEEARIFIAISILFGFFGAFCIGVFLREEISSQKKRRKAVYVSGASGSLLSVVLRKGINPLRPVGEKLIKNSTAKQFFIDLERTIGYYGYETSLLSLSSLLLGVIGILFLIGVLVASSLLFGFMSTLCLVLGINAWVKGEQEKRIEKVRDQIPNALQSMKTCFCVGYSLPQTLEQVGKETTGVLSHLFTNAYGIMEAGGTAYQALDYLKKQAVHSELVFLASALDIQHKTGSSMQQVLDIARDLVIEEIELERSLKTQTAQAKLSAQIVTIMPFVLIALFSFISPGFLDPFFESFVGLIMLAGSLFMQVVGVLMVRKMLQVKV